MARLRSFWVIAPLFAGACSIINAPADLDEGTGGGGGGTTTTSSTTSSTSSTTTTAPPDECGDGKLTGAEGCDDDNITPGDGCSATCQEEEGFTCAGEPGGLSTCTKDCGNGKLEPSEECDDGGKADTNPAFGNQDACNDMCRFKEFDLEATEMMVDHEAPIVGFRKDKPKDAEPEEATFFGIWHTTLPDKVKGRRYRRDGLPLLGTGSEDISGTNIPDASGHVMCTAPGNRSLVLWRDVNEQKIYARKIESDGKLQTVAGVSIPQASANPSCAASPDPGTFVVATTAKAPAGPLWDVMVQPFTSFALPQGAPVDVGDTTAPNDTAAWPLFSGFMVAWVVDPLNGGGFSAQELDKNGQVVAGAVYPLTDPAVDVNVREPFAVRIGATANDNSFMFGYTREAMDGHREVVLRVFLWTDMTEPPTSGMPIVVFADPSDQSQPSITINPMNNRLVIVWSALAPGGEDVWYATFDSKGMPIKAATKAPDTLVGTQIHPSAAVDPATGDVLMVWSTNTTGKPLRIAGKMFPKLLQ
jgi:cysteine-rich repeat protein